MEWDAKTANPEYGSFMPGLKWAVEHTKGPILELGAGYFSTPYLHDQQRVVVSYEYHAEWRQLIAERFTSDLHLIVDKVPTGVRWGVVLVDCEGWNRQSFFNLLKGNADIFVIHDTQDPWIEDLEGFSFKYEFGENPKTTLLSDVVDVTWCAC